MSYLEAWEFMMMCDLKNGNAWPSIEQLKL